MTSRCRICGHAGENAVHEVREMMLGTRATFRYVDCADCGSLQIAEIPDDLGRYYPTHYYSLQRSSAMEQHFKARWMAASLGSRSLLGRAFRRLYGPHPAAEWMRRAGLSFESPILDVGCGDGRLLRTMRSVGFTDLTGVDAFLGEEVREPGLRLLNAPPGSLDGPFELVMMHHSLEHVPDPRSTLRDVARLVPPGRMLLVRTPVAGSWAWRQYGSNWVQIDAPRHLHVLSEAAMRRVAEGSGFAVEEVVYDSSAFQLWGSELYARDIPYRPKPSYRNRPSRNLISREQMQRYREQARELNARGEGDSAAYYLRRVGS